MHVHPYGIALAMIQITDEIELHLTGFGAGLLSEQLEWTLLQILHVHVKVHISDNDKRGYFDI